ncbi:hypothetical protein GCM10010345_93970 [Streptomyces canarius]|uniref:Uncharacterized protein n=1 Tax=Streptomyces canarius TaxID=285453 RepID=A0ABQ3DE74_9ACTN|nr:hypothetical protein GCM10010345_93970 [Streptomyces canarius]
MPGDGTSQASEAEEEALAGKPLLYPVFHIYGLVSFKNVRLMVSWAVQRGRLFRVINLDLA